LSTGFTKNSAAMSFSKLLDLNLLVMTGDGTPQSGIVPQAYAFFKPSGKCCDPSPSPPEFSSMLPTTSSRESFRPGSAERIEALPKGCRPAYLQPRVTAVGDHHRPIRAVRLPRASWRETLRRHETTAQAGVWKFTAPREYFAFRSSSRRYQCQTAVTLSHLVRAQIRPRNIRIS